MPLPLIWVAWAAVGTITAAVGPLAKDVMVGRIKKRLADIGPEAIDESLRRMGLEVDLSKGLNDETITAAINGTLLKDTGLQLESVFDKQKMLNGFERLAVQRAAAQLGFADVSTEAGFRGAVQEWVSGELVAQLKAESGAVFDAAKESDQVKKIIEGGKGRPGWNTPSDLSPGGVANRLRQKKYRARHKKTWVPRGSK